MSIGGGGGGGFLGAIGGIVGSIFGGPIGAMIGQMLGQIVEQVAGQVLQQAGEQLGNVSEQGMQAGREAFEQAFSGNQGAGGGNQDLASLVNGFIAQLGGGNPRQSGDVQNAVQDLKDAITNLFNQMMQDALASNGKGGRRAGGSGGGGAGAPGGATGAEGSAGAGGAGDTGSVGGDSDVSGADDFFIAMARALGKTMQDQANKVKELADKVSGSKDEELTKNQTLLSAESQKMQFLSQTVQTALSAVGQSLSTLGRTQ